MQGTQFRNTTGIREEENLEGIDRVSQLLLKKANPIKFLPPFHFKTSENETVRFLDELGLELVKCGLENDLAVSSEECRVYFAEENYSSTNGRPITEVIAYRNFSPEYISIRPDRTVVKKMFNLGGASCVTAQLMVHNPSEIPSMVMAASFSDIPKYDLARKFLFNLSKDKTLIGDSEYQTYLNKFSAMDNWLISTSRE